MGVAITFITGHGFRESIEAIPGVEFVCLRGVADFDISKFDDYFPERSKLPKDAFQFLWDMEHVFLGSLKDQYEVLQSVLQRPDLQRKKVVVAGDPTFCGVMPMLLGSPQTKRVPVVAVAAQPIVMQSKDTAPFGMGLPSQGVEKNQELNAGARQMQAHVQAALHKTLEPYRCTLPLRDVTLMDDLCWLHDVYLQMSVEQLEPPRSDLRPNLSFIGTLLGANDEREHPDWWEDFIVNDKSGWPLVMVSSGTLPNMSVSELIEPTIEACRDLPVRLVVCAVHASKPASFQLPENARWAEWIAFEELFKYIEASGGVCITNGGYGGITQSFAAGIPMIVAGLTEDKAETTSRAEGTGAAINLRTQTPTSGQVKEALQKVLGEPMYKQKALELKKAYEDKDAVGSIVKAINEQVESFYGSGTINREANEHV